MGIRTGDPMEIYTDADSIILRKYAPGCAFCGSVNDIRYIHSTPVCNICANNMQMLYRTAEVGDPRAKAKVRRYIVWGIEDGIVCASFIAGIALAGWLFHILFAALGVA